MKLPAYVKKARGLQSLKSALERFPGVVGNSGIRYQGQEIDHYSPIPKFGPSPSGYDFTWNDSCLKCGDRLAYVETLSWDAKRKLIVSYCHDCGATYYFQPIEVEA